MSLSHLNIHHVRTISTAHITPHPRFNIFYGANGRGKTSLLEAIYLLSTGHSFRTREAASLISHGEEALTVFARTERDESISIQKSRTKNTQVKINQETCCRSSDLALFLPCQVFHHGIFHIIDEGPATRRALLDWGLFHVKPSYHALWKDYRRVIKQRNALLRQKASSQQCAPWDNLLVDLAYELDLLRFDYVQSWSAEFYKKMSELSDFPCTLHYYKGWDKKGTGASLKSILTDQFERDSQAQYTHSGAHHADLSFESSHLKAKSFFSRGQQKIMLIALKLAQAGLLTKPCVYLFDDLTAELDQNHIQRLMVCLHKTTGQFFITALDEQPLGSLISDQEGLSFSMECFT